MESQPWFEDLTRDLPSPHMVVDVDAFDRNLDRMLAIVRAGGSARTLRLATKSLRVPALIERALRRSQIFKGLMCYRLGEAETLARLNPGVFDDFLIAYPPGEQADLDAWGRLIRDGRSVRVVVDSEAHVAWIGAWAAAQRFQNPVELVLDLDLSVKAGPLWIGVRRSPLRSVADVLRLAQFAEGVPAVQVVGVMGYEAQVAGLGDRNPFKPWLNPIASWIRRHSMSRAARLRAAVAAAMKPRLFNGGGTGSLNWAAREPWLTEVTAGSGLLCSHLFDHYSNIRFEPAAFIGLRVVRTSPGFATLHGGGFVASGEPGWDRVPVPVWPSGLSLVSSEGCGEVQTPVKLSRGLKLQLGDRVWFRSAKAGEVMERFATAHLVSRNAAVQSVPTYRGLTWTW